MTQTAMDKETRPLPAGWKWVKLEELEAPEKSAFKIGPFGSSLKKTELVDSGIPICGIPNVLPNNFLPGYHRFISPEKYQQLYDYTVKPGDVLVTTMGTIGRAAVVPDGIEPMIYDSHIFRMRVDTSIVEPSLLSYAINGLDDLSYQIRSRSVGGIMAGLNTRILRTCYLALPPLEEQKRIAAILNEQMAAVEKAKKAAKERLEAAKALPAAYLREVFEGEESEDWPIKSLGDIGDVVAGITLGRKTKTTTLTDIPYLRVANVKDGYLELDDINEIAATEPEIEKLLLRKGDILLTEGGDPDKLGRGTIWAEEIPRCIHQNHIYRVRVDGTKYSPSFLSSQIGSSYGKRYFLGHAKQTTGIATINQTVLKGFPFHIPPLEQQDIIVKELDDKLAGVKLAEKSIQQELETIDAMPSALLRKAFSGEL